MSTGWTADDFAVLHRSRRSHTRCLRLVLLLISLQSCGAQVVAYRVSVMRDRHVHPSRSRGNMWCLVFWSRRDWRSWAVCRLLPRILRLPSLGSRRINFDKIVFLLFLLLNRKECLLSALATPSQSGAADSHLPYSPKRCTSNAVSLRLCLGQTVLSRQSP